MFNKRKMSFELVDHSIDIFTSRVLADTWVMRKIYIAADECNIDIKEIVPKHSWTVKFIIYAKASRETWKKFIRHLIDDLHGEIKNIHC